MLKKNHIGKDTHDDGCYLIPDVLLQILYFSPDRETFRNFQDTCKFFRSLSNQSLPYRYRQLPGPAINFGAFSETEPKREKYSGTTDLFSVKAHIQLNNGCLVTGGSHSGVGDTNKTDDKTEICIWEIPSRKLLFKLENSYGAVVSIIEIQPNIVAIAYKRGHVQFYNFNNRVLEKLGEVNLPERDNGEQKYWKNCYIKNFALLSSTQLAFCSVGSITQLRVLNFNYLFIKGKHTIDIQQVEDIAVLPDSLMVDCKNLFTLKEKNKLILLTYQGMFLYDLLATDKTVPAMKIDHKPITDYSLDCIAQLNDERIVLSHSNRDNLKKLNLEIWDFTKEDMHERCREVSFPVAALNRKSYGGYAIRVNFFQRISGEVLCVVESHNNKRDGHILVLDLMNGKEKILEELPFNYDKDLKQHQFIEDGRYFIFSHYGSGIEHIQFPLMQKNGLCRKC